MKYHNKQTISLKAVSPQSNHEPKQERNTIQSVGLTSYTKWLLDEIKSREKAGLPIR